MGSFAFLKSSVKDSSHRASVPPENIAKDEESARRGPSIAHALRQSQGRKRKGSLRKTAILGTGRLLRERRNSLRSSKSTMADTQMGSEPADADEETTPRRFSYENASLNSSAESGWQAQSERSASSSSLLPLAHEQMTPRTVDNLLENPIGPYASTTDDDEAMSFFHPTTSNNATHYGHLQSSGPAATLQRRRSNRPGKHSSLTIVQTPPDPELEDEWDYSETEWWGWVVLIVTWIVFVVGMGSCLGVWSWAWDVGETPYAPPELEDDPTLPITGYYPALMVCTAVMAWVWVVVAWVGMKYFRHSKEG
jgi:hypothetical protein